jgi:imidazolonepropionase-like amidohydrolase
MWWVVAAAHAGGLDEAEARGRIQVEPEPVVDAAPVVLKGGTVLTAAGQRYERGYIVLQGGKISAVGEGAAPEVAGATVIDVTGKVLTPGLIDTHSHNGVYPFPGGNAGDDGNEATAPTTPGVWAEHSLWPQDPGFELAIAGGVTTMQILPGSANLIGGRGFVIHNVPDRGSRAMGLEGAPQTVKMACGENPKRVYGEDKHVAPSTRMGNLRGQREAFLAAQAYAQKWADYDAAVAKAAADDGKKKKKGESAAPPKPPERDLDLETLVGVLQGKVLPEVHCYRADDMLAMLQVAKEFGFQVRSFHHATEAYKIRDVLAAQGVAASVWADWWGFKMEAFDAVPEGAAMLATAGVKAIIHSDSPVGIQRLNQEAGKAWAYGLHAGFQVTEDQALQWITANPAWALGIQDQVGTLEPGKRADVVVWDRDPFSVYAHAEQVFVDGALRYDRARPRVWSDYTLGQVLAGGQGSTP